MTRIWTGFCQLPDGKLAVAREVAMDGPYGSNPDSRYGVSGSPVEGTADPTGGIADGPLCPYVWSICTALGWRFRETTAGPICTGFSHEPDSYWLTEAPAGLMAGGDTSAASAERSNWPSWSRNRALAAEDGMDPEAPAGGCCPLGNLPGLLLAFGLRGAGRGGAAEGVSSSDESSIVASMTEHASYEPEQNDMMVSHTSACILGLIPSGFAKAFTLDGWTKESGKERRRKAELSARCNYWQQSFHAHLIPFVF